MTREEYKTMARETMIKKMQHSIFQGGEFEKHIKRNDYRGVFSVDEMRQAWDSCRPLEDLKVGDDATIILWSDTYGCRIVEVERTKAGKPKRIGLQKYEFHVNDYYDGEGEINRSKTYGAVEYYTLRRGGGWYAEGQPKEYGSVMCAVGYARSYRDPSF